MSSITSIGNQNSQPSSSLATSDKRPMPTVVSELATKFHQLRLRYRRWLGMITLSNALTAGICVWLLLATWDYWAELSTGWRTFGFGLGLSISAAIATWSVIRIANQTSIKRFAMQLEERFASIGQRLRTILELASGQLRAPLPMLTALAHQTLARWETTQPEQILPLRALQVSLGGTGLSMCVAVACGLSGPEMRTALLRAAGWDVAYTTLHVSPGNLKLLEGLQPEVQLELRGRPKRYVTLRYRDAEAEATSDAKTWVEAELNGSPVIDQPGVLVYKSKLDKLKTSMEYHFVTDVGTSPNYTITMQPKIVLLESSTSVQPPAYTQLPERSFSSDEVTVLAGSKVTVQLQFNRSIKSTRLMVGTNSRELSEMAISRGADGALWKFELPSEQNVVWQFSGTGEDDAPVNAVSGKLRVRHDEAPRLDWQTPVDELTVNMLAEVPMSLLISDDYGLTHAGMVFQLGESEEFVLKEWTLSESTEAGSSNPVATITTRLRLDEILPLESFALSEQDFISYYAFADDNREGQPQHAESEVRYLDIRPLKQYFSELDPAPGGGGNRRSFPALNELISRERYLYNRTRIISRHYETNSPEQLRTLERMVETQSELANFTRYLIEFLASQGNDDNEALAQAEAAMLQASDALATADFGTAILREEDAIRLLVEAKNTGEVSLLKMNPTMRTQLNNFQRQLLSRLRRKTKPSAIKLADDIRQVANDQKQLATRVANWQKQRTQESSEPKSGNDSAQTNAPQTENANGLSTKDDATKPEATSTATNETEQSSLEDQLKARQQELLDRLTSIDTELGESLKRSSLATERLAEQVTRMDALTGESAKGHWSAFPTSATDLANDLMELGEHVKAVTEGDATKRIASLRDLTSGLANQEIELADGTDRLMTESEPATQVSSMDRVLRLRAKTIFSRADTILDVLKVVPEGGDLRTGDITDQLEKLISAQEFREQLQTSAQSARNYAQASRDENWSVITRDRARDHAHMAQLLDQLHRQLVAPRIEQLRQMENRAGQLASTISTALRSADPTATLGMSGSPVQLPPANPSAGGSKTQDSEVDKSIRNLQLELQSQLQSAGLTELAETLDNHQNGQGNEPDQEQSGAAGSDQKGMGRARGGATSHFSHNRLRQGHRNVIHVQQQLQSLLQELILLETTVDRNAAVPAEYKELVDVYYKTLAGQDK